MSGNRKEKQGIEEKTLQESPLGDCEAIDMGEATGVKAPRENLGVLPPEKGGSHKSTISNVSMDRDLRAHTQARPNILTPKSKIPVSKLKIPHQSLRVRASAHYPAWAKPPMNGTSGLDISDFV